MPDGKTFFLINYLGALQNILSLICGGPRTGLNIYIAIFSFKSTLERKKWHKFLIEMNIKDITDFLLA